MDEAEQAALRGGQKIIAKLEMRIRELEQEIDGEQRRASDMEKEIKKGDRRIKELEFQVCFSTICTTGSCPMVIPDLLIHILGVSGNALERKISQSF